MASRILGMGDMLSLIEQAEREFDRETAEEGAARLLEGRFTLEDFLAQLQQVKKLGSLGGILSMLPGVPKELKHANEAVDDRQIAQVEAIIRSMTRAERIDPTVVDGSRRQRIARGSGTSTQEVNQLLRQFRDAQAMMRSPGMLSGLLGGGGGGKRMAGLAEALAGAEDDPLRELTGGGLPGLGAADDLGLPAGFGDGGPAAPAAGRTAKGGRKKKGGRVTPKSGRPPRGR